MAYMYNIFSLSLSRYSLTFFMACYDEACIILHGGNWHAMKR